MSRSTLILGTRGSKLAVHQSQWVQARLQELAPGLTISLKRIQTSGDKILDVPLAKIGGKGLFVKEIEDALSEQRDRPRGSQHERCPDGITGRAGDPLRAAS
jgi:porphobilinogen deaminase